MGYGVCQRNMDIYSKTKILNQAALLSKYGFETNIKLMQYAEEIEPFDMTNREAHAAKVYFNSLFGKEFSRDDVNSINAALNYGYGILLSNFNKELQMLFRYILTKCLMR